MLEQLKFVQGAVGKKDLLPALTHFKIEHGHVRSFNGTLALNSPIAFDIDCVPKAIPFMKAIQSCKETVSLNMTAKGKLSVKSGKFKAFIECLDTKTPHVQPEGEQFDLDGESLLKAIKTVAPFIGNDASRPWSNGILLCNQSAYATNNVVLIEYWTNTTFPITCNIPNAAVKEMLRINEAPIYAQSTNKSITFHYKDKRWLRTALYDLSWPDLTKILNVNANPTPIDECIFEALETIKPFTDEFNRVYFHKEKICTSLTENNGASYEIENFNHRGAYELNMLYLLKNVASVIDFSTYPKPCMFQGDKLRGAIIGLRI